jgi:hypothetical protein
MSWLTADDTTRIPAVTALLDMRGRVWWWQPRPGSRAHPGGCFQHRNALRTRDELITAYGRLIEVRDDWLLRCRVRATAVQCVLPGERIVLVREGIAGRVVAVWITPDRYTDRRTFAGPAALGVPRHDNGCWATGIAARSPLSGQFLTSHWARSA